MRPVWTWLAFALCLAVVLGAMGWISLTALRADRAEAEALALVGFEENVRLALAHMDSLVTPLVARENARPYFWYRAFYPAGRPYDRMFDAPREDEPLVASPLLAQLPPEVLVHFQLDAEGNVSSPQVPIGEQRALADSTELAKRITPAMSRLAELSKQLDFPTLLGIVPSSVPSGGERTDIVRQPPNPGPVDPPAPPQTGVAQSENEPAQNAPQGPSQSLALVQGQSFEEVVTNQEQRNLFENQRRVRAYNQAIRYQVDANKNDWIFSQNNGLLSGSDEFPKGSGGALSSKVHEGMIAPLWQGNSLLLVRQVTAGERQYIQGCWLDWPEIRDMLVAEVQDLLPGCRLEPVSSPKDGNPQRMLATLPVALSTGPMPKLASTGLTTVQTSLVVAWACVLVAAVAVAALLCGVLGLSERRARFVSAVTHELRTPLTTLRMYAEMLSEQMVPDQQRRQHYLDTLRREADRLAHLVENVLSYAQLERGRAAAKQETHAVDELVARVEDRLRERAEQAGMTLSVELADGAGQRTVWAGAAGVEQILFNLVDNACKYAAAAEDRAIHLRVEAEPRRVCFRVCDQGPGISPREARRLFRPFTKSDIDASTTAPGVGLGLSLSRRLARQMGGDLVCECRSTPGACFVLTLVAQ